MPAQGVRQDAVGNCESLDATSYTLIQEALEPRRSAYGSYVTSFALKFVIRGPSMLRVSNADPFLVSAIKHLV